MVVVKSSQDMNKTLGSGQRDVEKNRHLKSHLHQPLRRQRLTSDTVYLKRRGRNTSWIIGTNFRTTCFSLEFNSDDRPWTY